MLLLQAGPSASSGVPFPATAPTPTTSRPPGGVRHVAGMDGLRALAILVVLLYHAGLPGMRIGWLGVDLFFVLSGFLITTLLAHEQGRTGRVSLRRFWARRFLRLMPAYWLYAGAVTSLILVARWGWTSAESGWTPAEFVGSIWLYYSNYLPLFGIWEHQHLTGHLWSLAVEEQFYLAWPTVFVLASRRGLAERVAWGLVLAVVLTCWCVDRQSFGFWIYTRGLGMMMGSAVALSSARPGGLVARLGSPAARPAVLGSILYSVAMPTALVYAGKISEHQVRIVFCPVFCGGVALLCSGLWHGPADRVSRWLSWPPLVYLGRISYGLYLYHMAAHYLVWSVLIGGLEDWDKGTRYGVRLSAYLSLTMGLAMLSYHLLERPFLGLKARLR